ncbi:F0F1 ATP synthase subunit gamma [Alishewanella sp. SMS9]|uniref:F0F1 ATP synthase subunit gamma n=1 Tax=Pseudoalteromonas tunicata TaxID=314281 RepID=UPI00273DBF97|nr:F0F1 ATP synthase subunit gamma [Pseudoalteromonas tunicata]MDP5205521.1 F0F1 ATP synthase subunit gamma [Alishewanella sp. SMS9]MDP5215495.1 F0F1 ATP synthase subunit gamma [Pseudoalteromonas tunicata]
MSQSIASLRHKINRAQELGAVVKSMKAIASSSINQYERAVGSLDEYYLTVQQGLSACFNQQSLPRVTPISDLQSCPDTGVIVFGTDQGLVGKFNEVMVQYVTDTLESLPGNKVIWTVGERLHARFNTTPLEATQRFLLPNSISAIRSLVATVLQEMESQREQGLIDKVYLFHHRPERAALYRPVNQLLLPLDHTWQQHLAKMDWPSKALVQVLPSTEHTLRGFVREYLFVSLFRACALSLASENASRLAAMQRAEKNIDALCNELTCRFHRLRQSGIDEELFDVVSGFEALNSSAH